MALQEPSERCQCAVVGGLCSLHFIKFSPSHRDPSCTKGTKIVGGLVVDPQFFLGWQVAKGV